MYEVVGCLIYRHKTNALPILMNALMSSFPQSMIVRHLPNMLKPHDIIAILQQSIAFDISSLAFRNVFWMYRLTKKNGHHQKSNNFQILFRLTQNISYIRSSLCSRHLQSLKSVLQQKLCFTGAQKMCSKWAPRCCRHIWIRRAKFSMTLPHSSLGIALIAAFMSAIVWGLLPYTLSLRYPHI